MPAAAGSTFRYRAGEANRGCSATCAREGASDEAGVSRNTGLAETREKARHARQLLAQGIGRIEQQNATQQHQAANARTFREAAVA